MSTSKMALVNSVSRAAFGLMSVGTVLLIADGEISPGWCVLLGLPWIAGIARKHGMTIASGLFTLFVLTVGCGILYGAIALGFGLLSMMPVGLVIALFAFGFAIGSPNT